MRDKILNDLSVYKPPYAFSLLWQCFIATLGAVTLIALMLVYDARSSPHLWRVLEEKIELSQPTVFVGLDANHVIYVGNEKKIVPLDGVLEAVLSLQKTLKDSLIVIHIAPTAEAKVLIDLVSTLQDLPLLLKVWDET